MSVVDASVVAELILGLARGDAAAMVFEVAEDKAAPDLVNAEVLQTIRAHERRRLLTPEGSDAARRSFLELPLTVYPTRTLVDRAWELRQNFTACDAMYVALAEALETRLVTADDRLANAVRAHAAIEVELLT